MTYTLYPNAIDSTTQLPITVDNTTPVRAEVVNRQRSAIIAIESELGVQPSGTYTTVRARLDALTELISTGSGLAQVLDEGTVIRSNVRSMNFIGSSVVVTSSVIDGRVDVTLSGGAGGNETLAQTLALGNVTGGNDIVLSSGDVISSAISLVTIDDDLEVNNRISALGLILDEQASTPFDPTATSFGTVWVRNDTVNSLFYTDNSGIDHDLVRKDVELSGTANTVGNTPATLLSYTVPDNTAVTIDMIVTGNKDDDTQACGFKLTGTFRRSGGTVSQVGNIAASFFESDDGAWGVDLIINSTAIEVEVTGNTGDTVDWKGVGAAVLSI